MLPATQSTYFSVPFFFFWHNHSFSVTGHKVHSSLNARDQFLEIQNTRVFG